MRADARRNYDHLIAIARRLISDQGAGASLRDIARQADVGLGTLYRHFPTREALLEALLRESLDDLTRQAASLMVAASADEALVSWFREGVDFVRRYKGVVDLMAVAIADPASALHASCVAVRTAGAELLARAQRHGSARADLSGIDLFALMAALGWLGEQQAFIACADHLISVIGAALLSPTR